MSASEPPNVACIRKREASAGSTSGVGGVPATCSTTSAETAPPGFGLRTCRSKGPATVGSTVAVSWPEELNCVGIGTPLASAVAPLIKFAPLRTTVLEPMFRELGAAPSSVGTGFSTCTFTIMVELGLSTLVACTTTRLLGVGTTAGAVYTPWGLMVPICALPPATPFTVQVSVVSCEPVTVGTMLIELLTRTLVSDGCNWIT